MPLFESYDRRIKQINEALAKYGIGSIEEAEQLCLSKGINVREIVNGIQPIAFENAGWAYVVGAAIAIKKGCTKAADAAEAIGEGLQSFCIPGSVADDRKVGLGHGNLAAMLLRDETECFCFLAGHESFAAAEGAIGIAKSANRVRKQDLRVCLNGLGKDAAYIISLVGVFSQITQIVSSTGLDAGGLDLKNVLSLTTVVSGVTIFSIIEVVIFTILATIIALIYNVVSSLVGGVHVTLGDD